jgi:hypothetical protein
LHDENNPYYHSWFYDNVEDLSIRRRAEMAKAPFLWIKYTRMLLKLIEVFWRKGYSETNVIQ